MTKEHDNNRELLDQMKIMVLEIAEKELRNKWTDNFRGTVNEKFGVHTVTNKHTFSRGYLCHLIPTIADRDPRVVAVSELIPEIDEFKPVDKDCSDRWWHLSDIWSRIEFVRKVRQDIRAKITGKYGPSLGHEQDKKSYATDKEKVLEEYRKGTNEVKRAFEKLYPEEWFEKEDEEEYLDIPLEIDSGTPHIFVGQGVAPRGMINKCLILSKDVGEWVIKDHPSREGRKILYCKKNLKI